MSMQAFSWPWVWMGTLPSWLLWISMTTWPRWELGLPAPGVVGSHLPIAVAPNCSVYSSFIVVCLSLFLSSQVEWSKCKSACVLPLLTGRALASLFLYVLGAHGVHSLLQPYFVPLFCFLHTNHCFGCFSFLTDFFCITSGPVHAVHHLCKHSSSPSFLPFRALFFLKLCVCMM